MMMTIYIIGSIYLLGWILYGGYLFYGLSNEYKRGLKDILENLALCAAFGFLWWYWIYYEWKTK